MTDSVNNCVDVNRIGKIKTINAHTGQCQIGTCRNDTIQNALITTLLKFALKSVATHVHEFITTVN